MIGIFKICRRVPAFEIALKEGLHLCRRGSRYWASCPLHGEETPSLMFDEDGKWHCFGCNRGGDSVAFYAAFHGTTPYEAAKQILQYSAAVTQNNYRPTSPAIELRDRISEWYRREWNRACVLKHKASRLISIVDESYELHAKSRMPFTPPASFYKWVGAKAAAECRLESLQQADLYQKFLMMREEEHEHVQT